jgi:hypothetical protein
MEPELPGEEISSTAFGEELHARIEAYRREEIESYSLEEVRAEMESRRSHRRELPDR